MADELTKFIDESIGSAPLLDTQRVEPDGQVSQSRRATPQALLDTGRFTSDEVSDPGTLGETFRRGGQSGVRTMQADMDYMGAIFNTLTGDEEAAMENIEDARFRKEQGGQLLEGTLSFEDFVENPTFAGLIEVTTSGVGTVAPMAGVTAATAGVGGITTVLGKKLLSGSGRAATKQILKEIEEKQRKGIPLDADELAVAAGAAKSYASAAKAGAISGAFVPSYISGSGQSFGEFDEAGVELDDSRARQALAIGLPIALIDTATEVSMVGGLFNLATKKARKDGQGVFAAFASNLGKEVAKNAGKEGVAELAQEEILIQQRQAVDDNYSSQEANLRRGEAAFLGATAGGAFGAAGGTIAGVPAASRVAVDKAREVTAQARQMLQDTQDSTADAEVQQEVAEAAANEDATLLNEVFGPPTQPEANQDTATQEDTDQDSDIQTREMGVLDDELRTLFDENPDLDPRNIDEIDPLEEAETFGVTGFTAEQDPRDVQGEIVPTRNGRLDGYAVSTPAQQQNDPNFTQKFDLLNRLYEQQDMTDDNGVSLLEPYRNEMSGALLDRLIQLNQTDRQVIDENTSVANNRYFVDPITVNGERRLAIVAVPTDTGRRLQDNQGERFTVARFVQDTIGKLKKGKPEESPFTFVGADMSSPSNIDIEFVINPGKKLNAVDERGVIGMGLSPVQALKLGMTTMLGELGSRGYGIRYKGNKINWSNPRSWPAALRNTVVDTDAFGKDITLAEVATATLPRTESQQMNVEREVARRLQRYNDKRARMREEEIAKGILPEDLKKFDAKTRSGAAFYEQKIREGQSYKGERPAGPPTQEQQQQQEAREDFDPFFDPSEQPDTFAEGDSEVMATEAALQAGVFDQEIAQNMGAATEEDGELVRGATTDRDQSLAYTWSRIKIEDSNQPTQGFDGELNQDPAIAARQQQENRKARRARKKSAPYTLHGPRLSALTDRILNVAVGKNGLFNFSKPVDVFTLSDLEANFDTYAGPDGLFSRASEELRITIDKLRDRSNPTKARLIRGDNRYVIIINDAQADFTINDAFLGSTLAHEIGHIVFYEAYEQLASNPRNDKIRTRVLEAFESAPNRDSYDGKHAFEEWYADQVASYVYDKSKKATDGVSSYFKRVAKSLRDFFDRVNKMLGGRFTQNETFRRYMDFTLEAHKASNAASLAESAGQEITAGEKLVIREMAVELAENIPGEVQDKPKKLVDQVMRTGVFKFLNRHAASVDGWLRSQGPAGVALAQFFYGRSQSTEDIGFHKAKTRKNNEFNNKLAAIFGIKPGDLEGVWNRDDIRATLQLVEDESINTADLPPEGQRVRALMEEIFDDYITNPETGRTWFQIDRRRNYAPRMLDFIAIQDNQDKFKELLQRYGISGERLDLVMQALNLNDSESADIPATQEATEGMTPEQIAEIEEKSRLSPGMDARAVRTLAVIPTKVLRDAEFLQPPGVAIVQYFHQVTRKVEYERRGGYARIKELLDQMDPDETLPSVGSLIGRKEVAGIEFGREEQLNQRSATEDAIMAQLGKVGAGMNPHWRTLNSIGAVHTALTTLMFTVFASVTDLAGIALRSKDADGVKQIFAQSKEYFAGDKQGMINFARDVGVITMDALENMFIATGELDFANATARKMMGGWFKVTGLNWYTRYTRILAASAGKQFLIRTANTENFTQREARYLQELGVTREEVQAWQQSGFSFEGPAGDKMRQAIFRFSDEAIIRPSAAERPTWASNPYFTLVWQLKSYFYAYGKTVLGGMGREIVNRNSEDGNFNGAAPLLLLAAGTMIPLTMAGLELREYTKYLFQMLLPGVEASEKTFRSDRMDAGEYAFEIFDRSGVMGPWTLALTTYDSLQWEGALGPIISNIPFIDAFDDTFLDGDWNRPIPVLNNIQ